MSVVVRNTYEGITDYMPELWHKKLIIALSHDDVRIENDQYVGGVSLDGDYGIEWQEFLDYPVAQSSFTIQVTPFDATNSNCMTCQQVQQLNLTEDTYPVPVGDGDLGGFNVYDNDSICCYPATGEIIYTNAQFLSAANLSPDGSFSFTAQNPVPNQAGVKIATYRVTCEDGSYDEADVFADFIRSGEATCCDPFNAVINDAETEISFEAGCNPDNGFAYDFRKADAPGVPVFSGTIAGNIRTVSIPGIVTGLSGDYLFTIKSICGSTESQTLVYSFSISPAIGQCYGFDANYSALSGPSFATFSYMNCAGNVVNQVVGRFNVVRVCAAVYPDNTPIYWASDQPSSSFTPMGPCAPVAIVGDYGFSVLYEDICSDADQLTGYSSVPFGTGVILYYDQEFNTPITTYNFVKGPGGQIYTIDPVTGAIGTPTGDAC